MKTLNIQQKKAITHDTGPLLIIAGAGTGKTTVVTERIKHLILEKNVKPHEVLALTFTEKSAREMEERVDVALPYGYTQMWISTFHSFCDRVLRNDAINIGLTPGYRLMTQAESVKFFRDQLFQLNLDYYRPLGNPTKFVSGLLTHFSRLKDEDIDPQFYLDYVKKTQRSNKEIEKEELQKLNELANAFNLYEKMKAREGVMDFSDLIGNTLKLFRKRPNVLRQYRKQFAHVLVDEFQDTNIAQYELIKLLSPVSDDSNLVVVGDDSQSIYKFRGAAISNILSFMDDYKNAKQIVLDKNYRSTQTILDHSHQLIKQNDPDTLEAQLGISKSLQKMRDVKERDITSFYTERVEDEAEEVVNAIKHENIKSNRQWKDFAILVRANDHADPFVRALKRHGIPFQFLGPGMLFRQKEVKDLIAYLKVLNDFQDSPSLYRVLTMKNWNLSGRDIAGIANLAKKYNCSLFEAMEQIVKDNEQKGDQLSLDVVDADSKETIGTIVSMIYRHMALVPKETAGQILYYFLEDIGMIKEMAEQQSVEEEKRIQNISKFFDKLKSYEATNDDASVPPVVDWIDLSMELGESPLAADTDWVENDAVNILTLHSSKGLEFPVVFLVNLTTGRFPTYNRREQIPIPDDLIKEHLPEGDFHVQEERRLFYVGMTRAQDRLFLTASKFYGEAKRERKLSPFVGEAVGHENIEALKYENNEKKKQLSFLDFSSESESRQVQTINRNKDQITNYQLPISYLSYSQIETFKFCPMHYKARYVLKLPSRKYAAATYGTVMHQTMRHFYEKQMHGEEMSQKDMIALYRSFWNPVGFESREQEKQLKALGEKQLKAYYKAYYDKKQLPDLVERQFIFPVKKDLKFGGVVDRLDLLPDGKIEIIDYKTSNKIPTQKQIDKNLQLTLYALAATEVPEIGRRKDPEDIVLSLFFFKENIKMSTTRTREQLAEAQKEVIEIAEKISESDFSCSGVKWCNNCEYKMLCGV